MSTAAGPARWRCGAGPKADLYDNAACFHPPRTGRVISSEAHLSLQAGRPIPYRAPVSPKAPHLAYSAQSSTAERLLLRARAMPIFFRHAIFYAGSDSHPHLVSFMREVPPSRCPTLTRVIASLLMQLSVMQRSVLPLCRSCPQSEMAALFHPMPIVPARSLRSPASVHSRRAKLPDVHKMLMLRGVGACRRYVHCCRCPCANR
jgi:hypothetical protein